MWYKAVHAFGLDISDNSLELVLLNKKREIKLSFREKLPFGIINNGQVKDKQFLADVLLKLKEKAGWSLKTENVVLSIPENKIFAHIFSIPVWLVNNVKVILKIAQEHIPLNLNESIFDYKVMENKHGSKDERKIFFAAAEQQLIYDYLEVLNLAKLKPIAIDIEPICITRALTWPQEKKRKLSLKWDKKEEKEDKKNVKWKEKDKKTDAKIKQEQEEEAEKPVEKIIKENLPQAKLLIDIGNKLTITTLYYNGNIFPSISIPIAGYRFTQIIQTAFKTKDFEKAEQIKLKMTSKSQEYHVSRLWVISQ